MSLEQVYVWCDTCGELFRVCYSKGPNGRVGNPSFLDPKGCHRLDLVAWVNAERIVLEHRTAEGELVDRG